ncbi:MAG: hypothetical protein R3B96_08875 [Pirellulaceae bacterium]
MYRAPRHLLEPLAEELRRWPDGIRASVSADEGILLVLTAPETHQRVRMWVDRQIEQANQDRDRESTLTQEQEPRPEQIRDARLRFSPDEGNWPPSRYSSNPANNGFPPNRIVNTSNVDEQPTFVRRWVTLPIVGGHEPLGDLAQLFAGRLVWDSPRQNSGQIALRSGESLTRAENPRSRSRWRVRVARLSSSLLWSMRCISRGTARRFRAC